MFPFNAGYRAGITDNFHAVGIKADFGRLQNIGPIATVVDGIDKSFAQRWDRVADPAFHLAAIILFIEVLSRNSFQVPKAIPQLGS